MADVINKSLWQEYVQKYLQGVVVHTIETLNGKAQQQLDYRYKQMLTPTYSATGMWETLNVFNSRVSADFVALDSSLPLKKRDTLRKAVGSIVKSGMELSLNEQQITDIETMQAQNAPQSAIIARLMEDTPRVISGIYELMERCFLEGLSTGSFLLDDTENIGIGVRMDFSYLDENKFTPTVNWNDKTNAKPLDDLRRIVKKARNDGYSVNFVLMDDNTFEDFSRSEQVRQYYGWAMGFSGNNTNIPVPTLEQANQALARDNRYGFQIEIIDRTCIVEKNGKRTTVTPWAKGMVICLQERNVGVLSWARVAEATHPVAGVEYANGENGILVSKFSTNRPSLKEFTCSQARCVPVICNVESIFQLDAYGANVDKTANDNKVTLWGTDYAVSAVVSALTAMGKEVNSSIGETDLIALVNELSKKEQNTLKAALS